MVKRRSGEGDADAPEWSPAANAVRRERWGDPDNAGPTFVLVEHQSDPFIRRGPDAEEATLRAVALDYLKSAKEAGWIPLNEPIEQQLMAKWIAALEAVEDDAFFGWSPIQDPLVDDEATFLAPLGSGRLVSDGDHMVALFAGQRLDPNFFLGSGFGLRVVLHVRPLPALSKFEISIAGFVATLPFGVYAEWAVSAQAIDIALEIQSFLLGPEIRNRMSMLAGLDEGSVGIHGLRIGQLSSGDWQIERRGVGTLAAVDSQLKTPYAVSVLSVGPLLEPGTDTLLHRSPLVADANGEADIFVQDPLTHNAASPLIDRRPRRDEGVLDAERSMRTIGPVGITPTVLEESPHLAVLPSPRFVRADVGAPSPMEVALPGTGPAVRSDSASAVQGFWHARDLLDRLQAYGISVPAYFRFTKARIEVAYRSGVSPGPGKDGRTVNARVLPEGWAGNYLGTIPAGVRPKIELHLALADLARRARGVWVQGAPPMPAQPMGIGADARWMWHEFGHVLTLATTGELELRFAHSPGDALAAIVLDPDSQLALKNPLWRGMTFPWVQLGRRHDRCVLHGWSWSGAMHAELAQVPAWKHPRRKGYLSEQILSSALFRLYRCIGGDCLLGNLSGPDLAERRRASHYATYLIMKGLWIFGLVPMLEPPEKAETFEFSLQLADRSTGTWSATYPATGPGSATYARVGGCSIKLIRWVFEAQGLHGVGPNGNQPGASPDVDVYIANLRPVDEVTTAGVVHHGPGSYVPVSNHWQAASGAASPPWQADPINGMSWSAAAQTLDVKVGNRGQKPTNNVVVAVHYQAWTPGTAPPVWDAGASWTPSPSNPSPAQSIPAGGGVPFGPFALPLTPGSYVVLAIAYCPDDRPNLDPATALACAYSPTRVDDLVAGDNNLGLLFIVVP